MTAAICVTVRRAEACSISADYLELSGRMGQHSFDIRIRALAEQLAPLAEDTRWYRFGSSLRGEKATDVDVLIVYDHPDHARAADLLRAVHDTDQTERLDVTILSAAEETEIGAINHLHAELVWPTQT